MNLEQARDEVKHRLISENELPTVPPGWSVERFRFVFTESKERNGAEPVGNMLSVSEYRGVVPKRYDHDEQRRSEGEIENYRVVRPGQLAVNSMWLNHLGLGVSDYLGHVSPAYGVYDLSPRIEPRFAHHLLRSQFYLRIYMRYLYGIRPNSFQVKANDWANIPVLLPDLETQKAIADFLDREIARIDELIEKKQRLVEVLGETRNSIISRGTTIGLGHSEQLMNTGSQYLPDIPKGWRIWRLKQLAEIRGGLTLGRSVPDDAPVKSVPYLRVANVQAGWLDLGEVYEIDATPSEISRYSLTKGDVLMNEGGDNDKLGRGAVWEAPFEPCLNQNHVFCVRPKKRLHADWISLATNARYARDFFYLHSNQSTNLASISKTNLGRFPVAMPPDDQIPKLLSRIMSKLSKVDEAAKQVARSVARLREYRAALITAAVTGQIDVDTYGRRGAADRTFEAIGAEMSA